MQKNGIEYLMGVLVVFGVCLDGVWSVPYRLLEDVLSQHHGSLVMYWKGHKALFIASTRKGTDPFYTMQLCGYL